jgi:hypothetical protein
MKKTVLRIVALFMLCVVAVFIVFEKFGRNDSDKQSEQAQKKAETLRLQIREEIKSLGNHAWAGDYYWGDGLGANVSLMLAPKSGYVFEWHGCVGVYDRNYGAVTWTKDRIRLSFTFPNERKGFQGIAEEFIPIAWGDRKYLIPADDIVGFCNKVNAGDEPRKDMHGRYLLRDGDEKKDVKGFPSVPEEFKPHLLANPIEADIVGVGKATLRSGSEFKETPVTLNSGKKQGLLVGMALEVIMPDNLVESVTVTKVEDERSEALMTQFGEKDAGPQIGWRLSTRCRWNPVAPLPTKNSSR